MFQGQPHTPRSITIVKVTDMHQGQSGPGGTYCLIAEALHRTSYRILLENSPLAVDSTIREQLEQVSDNEEPWKHASVVWNEIKVRIRVAKGAYHEMKGLRTEGGQPGPTEDHHCCGVP